jgi:hypothetical protein
MCFTLTFHGVHDVHDVHYICGLRDGRFLCALKLTESARDQRWEYHSKNYLSVNPCIIFNTRGVRLSFIFRHDCFTVRCIE